MNTTAQITAEIMTRHGGRRLPGAWTTTRGLPLHAVCVGPGQVWQMPDARAVVAASRENYDAVRAASGEIRPSAAHPTVDLPAYLEGPRLPTTYTPVAEDVDHYSAWLDAIPTDVDHEEILP